MTIKPYSKDALGELASELREAFSLPNQALRSMLVPHSLGRPDRHKFVIAVSPLSYRRAMGKSKDYKRFRDTASDYVGLWGILQAFELLYGFQTLPEITDPEDCADCVMEEKMTLYCIASPKTNRWTGRLLEKFGKAWEPCIDFRADSASEDLKNIKVSLYIYGSALFPDGWDVNADGDRYIKDFGVIIRGQNPFHGGEMMTVIAGRSSLGTEAASRALTSPEKIDEISGRLSELGASLENHAQPFWALVSMERESGGSEEPIPGSLLLRHVGVFKLRS